MGEKREATPMIFRWSVDRGEALFCWPPLASMAEADELLELIEIIKRSVRRSVVLPPNETLAEQCHA